jgi:hypothetical protein
MIGPGGLCSTGAGAAPEWHGDANRLAAPEIPCNGDGTRLGESIGDFAPIQSHYWREVCFPVLILLRSRRTVDPDLESELKTDVRLLPKENPGAEQDR